jgi:hypothetical protein
MRWCRDVLSRSAIERTGMPLRQRGTVLIVAKTIQKGSQADVLSTMHS